MKKLETMLTVFVALAVSIGVPEADEVNLDWATGRPGGAVRVITDGGGFIYVATSQYLMKYDSDGNELWERALDSLGGLRPVAWWIDMDPAGNILVVGDNSAIPLDVLVFKYDADGNQLWEVRMPETRQPRRVAADAAGNVYVIGTDWTTSDVWRTAKFDPDGNQLWLREFSAGPFNSPASMAVSPAGEVAVTGDANVVGNEYDIVTVVYETDGTQRWWRNHTSTIPGGGQDRGTCVVLGDDGEVYVAGHSENQEFSADMTLIKYDAAGNQLWLREYRAPAATYNFLQWIDLDSAGNILGAGQSSGEWTALKWDPDGNLLWSRQFDGVHGGENLVRHMVVGPDDAMYIVGKNGVGMITAVKYDSLGNQDWHILFSYGGSWPNYWGTSVALDAGNNVVLGVSTEVIFHYLQADCSLGGPTEVFGVGVDPDKVTWAPGINGEQYDVARGDLGAMRGGSVLDCMVTETANPFCEDPDTPLPGDCFAYLVRPTSVCGIGNWGAASAGQQRDSACP